MADLYQWRGLEEKDGIKFPPGQKPPTFAIMELPDDQKTVYSVEAFEEGGMSGGERCIINCGYRTAFVKLEGPRDFRLIAHTIFGGVAFAMIPEAQATYSHAIPQENDERAHDLGRIATDMEKCLPYFERVPEDFRSQYFTREMNTFRKVVEVGDRLRAGELKLEDRALFWGYDNQWSFLKETPKKPKRTATIVDSGFNGWLKRLTS